MSSKINSASFVATKPSQQLLAQKVIDLVDIGYTFEGTQVLHRKSFSTVQFYCMNVKAGQRSVADDVMKLFVTKGYSITPSDEVTTVRIPRVA